MSNAIAVRDKKAAIERLTTSLEQVVQIRSEWLEDKRRELASAIEAQKALAGTGASETKLRYARNRVAVLRKIVNCLEAGFVPIPTFDSEKINVDIQQFPLKALLAINDANASGLFDEVRYVKGREQERFARMRSRDPLLIGTVRAPAQNVTVRNQYGYEQTVRYPAIVQDFLLAWWKPTDEVPEDMF